MREIDAAIEREMKWTRRGRRDYIVSRQYSYLEEAMLRFNLMIEIFFSFVLLCL